MKRLLLAIAVSVLGIGTASAACVPPAVMKDNASTTFNMSMATAADGNCASSVTVQSGGVASGAIASGAVASGAVAAGALASGAGVDGWDLTQGAKADSAWVSGSGSVIAILKNIANGIAAAIPSGTARIGYTSDDPCTQLTKTNLAIATSSGTVQLVAPSGSTQVYVCSFSLIAASTAVVNLVGGTGATCTTGTPVAALGSTTAANGMSLAANGGLTFGNGGATVTRTTTAGHGLCLIQSGTTALAGSITYVQQ